MEWKQLLGIEKHNQLFCANCKSSKLAVRKDFLHIKFLALFSWMTTFLINLIYVPRLK
jgi:hypothetical protein